MDVHCMRLYNIWGTQFNHRSSLLRYRIVCRSEQPTTHTRLFLSFMYHICDQLELCMRHNDGDRFKCNCQFL